MGNVFVPYAGKVPAAIDINGHRLIILATEREPLANSLGILGGDCVRQYSSFNNSAELKIASERLAKSSGAGVVIAPAGIEMNDLLRSLAYELPWVH